jgi:hypothetical protein
MCQPSASSAREPEKYPTAISTTIITAVSATTARTPRSRAPVSTAVRTEQEGCVSME